MWLISLMGEQLYIVVDQNEVYPTNRCYRLFATNYLSDLRSYHVGNKVDVEVFGSPRSEWIIEVEKMLFPQWEKNAPCDEQNLLRKR